jgi:hypothetical protein
MLKNIFLPSIHWVERLTERFGLEETAKVERTVECAMKRAQTDEKIRYTHPLYGITVVIRKIGLNGAELVTCWKQGVWDSEELEKKSDD